MGCDAFANENGVFEIEIRDYDNADGKYPRFQPRVVRVEGLPPGHPIGLEVLEGSER